MLILTAINFTQNTTISGNTITGNGTDGINIRERYVSMVLKATVKTTVIANNTITGNADDGINVESACIRGRMLIVLLLTVMMSRYRVIISVTMPVMVSIVSDSVSDGWKRCPDHPCK